MAQNMVRFIFTIKLRSQYQAERLSVPQGLCFMLLSAREGENVRTDFCLLNEAHVSCRH